MQQLSACFSALASDRSAFQRRGEINSAYTLPSLILPEGVTGQTDLIVPFQSTGAACVNSLASKLLLALFPPNTPFFKLKVDASALADALEAGGFNDEESASKARAEIEQALVQVENKVMAEIEAVGARVALAELFKHLLVSGNGLLQSEKDGHLRFFPLSQFVVERDPRTDRLIKLVIRERIPLEKIPPLVIELAKLSPNSAGLVGYETNTHFLYTGVFLENGIYQHHQEIDGVAVPGSAGTYTLDSLPYIPVRWEKISGESYGRSLVEQYLGDIQTLEGLSQAVVEGAIASSKILFLVNPNGSTRIRDLATAPNGAFRAGIAEEVAALQSQKSADLNVAATVRDAVRQELNTAFLRFSAIQRQAERVTAEEIRLMAQELEDQLGGAYSVLAQELQLPLITLWLYVLRSKLPKLPTGGSVKPVVVTGIEALGRGHEAQRIVSFIQALFSTIGPEATVAVLKVGNVATALASAFGVQANELVKSAEELASDQQTAQAQAMVDKLGPKALDIAAQSLPQ